MIAFKKYQQDGRFQSTTPCFLAGCINLSAQGTFLLWPGNARIQVTVQMVSVDRSTSFSGCALSRICYESVVAWGFVVISGGTSLGCRWGGFVAIATRCSVIQVGLSLLWCPWVKRSPSFFRIVFCVSLLNLDLHHMGSWLSRVLKNSLYWCCCILGIASVCEGDEVQADGRSMFTLLLIIFSFPPRESAVCSYFSWRLRSED